MYASIIAGDNNAVNAGGICERIAARNNLRGMSTKDRRAERTPEEKAESAALKAIFDAKKEALGLTQEKAAADLGITQGSLNNYLSGRNALNPKAAADIARLIGVKVQLFSERLANEIRQMYESVREDKKPELASVVEMPTAVNDANYAFITQYTARVAAGDGSENNHVEVKGQLAFKRAWLKEKRLRADKLMVVYAEGISMMPTISDGDVVLIDETRTDPVDGELFGLKLPTGKDVVKRLQKLKSGEWMVVSDNPDFRPFFFSSEDGDEVKILGRVVWRGGDL